LKYDLPGGFTLKKYDVIVIGGGPAGLFAAIMCADPNKRVAVLERNKRCGRKLLMTGAGKCNLTQGGDITDFFTCYGKNGKFLKHALLTFTNEDLLRFFRQHGMEFVTTEHNKVFPKSLKAVDVLNVLISQCQRRQVEVITEAPVETIEPKVASFMISTPENVYESRQVIVATGGLSYPVTGSTGDGQRFAKELGHKIIPMKPALTPLKIKNYALAKLSGQSFENLAYTLWRQGKKLGSYKGDVLLTHTGLSGPGILNNSRYMQSQDVLKLNFIGGSIEEMRQNLTKQFNLNGKALVKTVARDLGLSKRFVDTILSLAKISDDQNCAELKKEQRQALLKLLTEFEMEIKELGGFHMAMVTAGGVTIKEIHPKTMESQKVKGLYFIGEIADIDGDTGGYNLQAAMSMAFVAAEALK